MADVLKSAYYALEDKYYALLDGIQKVIPIYSVVDPIDKVIPSFVLVLIVIILAIGAIVAGAMGPGIIVSPNASTINFSVLDQKNAPLQGAKITLGYDAESLSLFSSAQGTAAASVPLDKKIDFEVSLSGYKAYSDSFNSSAKTIPKRITLEAQSAESLSRTINLLNAVGQPLLQPVTLDFSCTNPQATAPDDQVVSNGTTTVQVPENCGTLKATAKAKGFEDQQVTLGASANSIYLQESTIRLEAKGTIIVNADFNGTKLDGIIVKVFNDQQTEAVDSATTSNGQAKFELDAGNYFVLAQASQQFGEQKSEAIILQAGQTKTASLHMTESIKGNILVQVLDKDSGLPVDKASVTLKLGDTTIAGPLDTNRDKNSMLSFPVSTGANYTIVVDHQSYLVAKMPNATYGSTLYQVKLEKYVQGVNGGILKVRVVDQDSKPVQNARVALFDAQLSQNTGFGEQTTDINGTAKFTRVINGDYFAFAYKGGSSGKSDPLPHFDSRSPEVTLTVTITIPSTSLAVNVSDSEGKPFPFALVTVYDYLDNSKLASDYTDSNGTFRGTFKADKRVYVVVNDPQGRHADYVSQQQELLPNTEAVFNARLVLPGNSLKLEFAGLYKEDLKVSSSVEGGQEYTARFLLTIPKAVDRALVHVKTGNKDLVENDSWYIKSAAVPRASVLAGSSYSPNDPFGYNKDASSDTSNGMKWFNASWTAMKPGIYEVQARLKVRETASLGEQLNLEYRAWTETSGARTKYPEQLTPPSNDLYSGTKQEIFSVGPSTLCSEEFCFDATIMDLKQNLVRSVTSSYSARISQDYRLTFTITNNSAKVHNNSEIRVENPAEAISFRSYAINTASGQEFKAEAWNRYYVGYNQEDNNPKIDLGNFGPNNKVQATVAFSPRQALTSGIMVKIVSDYKVVFEKEIMVTTAAAKNFDITFTPKVLPSGTQNTLTFQVKDPGVSPPVEVANVWAKVMDHRKASPILPPAQTNSDGNVSFNIPAQLPGERLFVEFQKADFAQATVEVPVESSVLQFSPQSLSVTMNTQTKRQSSDAFTLQNKTSLELEITSIKVQGNARGLIDLTKTNNIFKSLVGVKIQPGTPLELNENNFLTEDGATLTESQTLDMQTVITVSAKGQSWQFSLPTAVSIGVGKEVESADCLAISAKSWQSSTEGNPVQTEFTVQNNCVVDGKPVDLRGLEAKLELKGNLLGTYALNLKDSDLLNSQELRPGYFKKILNVFEKEKTYTATLIFTPNGGVNGTETATVAFRATNPISGSKQFLTAKIETTIGIINLKDCVSFSKDIVQLNDAKQETFNVSTKGCAGTVGIKFDSELELSKNDFTLQATETSPEISVATKTIIPGAYYVDAQVKGAGQTTYKTVKTILVRALPPAGSCIDLDKFEFDVYNNPRDPNSGFDTLTLTNNCYERRQAVTFEKPAFTLANFFSSEGLKEGLKYALYGFIATLPGYAVNNLEQGKGALSGLDFGLFSGSEAPAASPSLANLTNQQKTLAEAGRSKLMSPPTGKVALTGYAIGASEIMSYLPSILGEVLSINPLLAAGIGLLSGFISNWFSQQDTTIDAVVRDIGVTDYSLLLPKAITETPTRDINISITGEPTTGILANGLENSSIGLAFQSTPGTPSGKFSRVFKVTGVQNIYGKTYSHDYLGKIEGMVGVITHTILPEVSGNPDKEFTQKFHLAFRNKNPLEDANLFIPPYSLNCQLGTKAGLTGENALPRVGLAQGRDWSWNDSTGIAFNSCDEGNENYVYCDAAQFSIEALKKLELVNRFLELNPNLNCPDFSQLIGSSVSNTIGANDIGLSKLSVQTLGADLNVIVEASNTNSGSASGTLRVALKNLDTNAIITPSPSTQSVSLGAGERATIGFFFTAPAAGNYRADANLLSVSLPSAGSLNDPSTDYLGTAIAVGGQGLQQCNPKTTDPTATISLKDFIAATEKARGPLAYFPDKNINSAADFQSKLVSFRAYLVKDGYSQEFQRDFDNYAMTKDFFGASTDYKTKFHNYFKDPSRLSFAPRYQLVPGSSLQLKEPGLYQVDFNITFGSDWQMFDSANNNSPKAKVTISMERVSSPTQPNPWYYLPFDGMIGADSGRIGYGLNYSGEPVQLFSSPNYNLRTIEIKGSNSKVLETSSYSDFKSLNVDNRGVVLSVQNTDAGAGMVYSPSLATPVIMQVTNTGGKEAWGFYSVGVDQNSASDVGQTMNYWYGIGLNCKDFEENPVMQAYQWTPDMHGINTKCARLGGIDNSAYSYGFEWCDATQTGNVFLKSVFFTPQGKESAIFRSGANEAMNFILASGLSADRVPLGGSLATNIASVKDVFEQVRGNNVCVSGTGAKQEFWWNPKAVLDSIAAQEKIVEPKCIQAS